MGAVEELIAGLSGESKALMLLTEFRLGRLGPQGLQRMLGFLVSSDLERMGLIALVQQQAPRAGVDQAAAKRLVAILAGEVDTAASAPTVARPLSQGFAPPAPAVAAAVPGGADLPVSPPSPPAAGTSFKVKLPPKPTAPPTPAPAAAPAVSAPSGGAGNEPFYGGNTVAIGRTAMLERMARRKILLADDDARIRMVFRKRLEDKQYLVDEADNGQVAWEKIQNGNFAAAILDMKMPGLHGLEIISRLSAAGSRMPVIICSAYSQLQDEFVIKTYPKVRFLPKPVPAEKLLGALAELLPEGGE